MKPALIFIISTIGQLVLLVLLLRFWLPLLRADFRNPISQGILALTNPIVIPVRRLIPPIGQIDTAIVLIAFGLQYLIIVVILAILSNGGVMPGFVPIAITSLINLIILSLNIFTFAIFIYVILSWIAPGTYNPATAFITMLVYPVMQPVRKFIPSLGGIDLSPLIVIIALQACVLLVGEYKPIPI